MRCSPPTLKWCSGAQIGITGSIRICQATVVFKHPVCLFTFCGMGVLRGCFKGHLLQCQKYPWAWKRGLILPHISCLYQSIWPEESKDKIDSAIICVSLITSVQILYEYYWIWIYCSKCLRSTPQWCALRCGWQTSGGSESNIKTNKGLLAAWCLSQLAAIL